MILTIIYNIFLQSFFVTPLNSLKWTCADTTLLCKVISLWKKIIFQFKYNFPVEQMSINNTTTTIWLRIVKKNWRKWWADFDPYQHGSFQTFENCKQTSVSCFWWSFILNIDTIRCIVSEEKIFKEIRIAPYNYNL